MNSAQPQSSPGAEHTRTAGEVLSAAAEKALSASSVLWLAVPGRRTGRAHQVELWFVYRDGALHFLAHARDHGRGTDWYRNLIAAGQGQVSVAGHRILVRPAGSTQGVDGYRHILALFEAKYGVGAVDSWYDPAKRIPLRLLPVREER